MVDFEEKWGYGWLFLVFKNKYNISVFKNSQIIKDLNLFKHKAVAYIKLFNIAPRITSKLHQHHTE